MNGLNDHHDGPRDSGQKGSVDGDTQRQNGDAAENGDAMDLDQIEDYEKPLAENPILMTEDSSSDPKFREKMLELAMENWGAPAFWLARTAVCAAVAQGKSQALVVDIGASHITVTPVHDGMILKKGEPTSPSPPSERPRPDFKLLTRAAPTQASSAPPSAGTSSPLKSAPSSASPPATPLRAPQSP